jgi:DNA-binding HxlR family transcriptional regulator
MATKVKKTGDERLFSDLNTSLMVFEMLVSPAGVKVALSERLFKLEDRGYVEPMRDEAGRKTGTWRITDAGHAAAARSPAFQDWARRWI